jgi:Dolichyl-phosphate-mannose-protein mannosyltransferase
MGLEQTSSGQAGRLERWLGAAVDFARRRPGETIAAVLCAHLVVWTALPFLLQNNLELDLVEDLALGKEWQLGYWKHPPLPWWIADAAYRLLGDVRVVYLLGPLAAVACMYVVWRLAREVVAPEMALTAVLALEGIHYFNFSVMKFAHDQCQLPFWALTGWLVYRGLAGGRMVDWALAGLCLALAFWSKYAAFALAATIGIFLLADPTARQSWRTPGPYVMAVAFAIAIAPQAWWLVTTGFQPFRYVDARAVAASHWYDFVVFPLRWTGGQVLALIPAAVLIAALYGGRPRHAASVASTGENSASDLAAGSFARRYVTALAIGPFLLTTLVALPLGRLPVTLWGYPLWSFAPLAAVMWLGPQQDRRGQLRFAAAFLAVFLAFPVGYAADALFAPLFGDRPRAMEFSGRMMAQTITAEWRAATGSPLVYAGGTQFAANNMAVYSPDRPHVVVETELARSAWIDPDDLRRRGLVIVWERNLSRDMPDAMRANFPDAEFRGVLDVPRRTLVPRSPVGIGYAFVKPRP